jgi:acetyl-CoA acetyltransferase
VLPDTPPHRRATIVGIGQTEFEKKIERSELALACDAIVHACEDCGIPVTEIDGITRYDVEQNTEWDVIYTLGIPHLNFFAGTPSGGGGVAGTIILAALAVESGHANTVVVYRARKRGRLSGYGAGANEGGRPWAKVGTLLKGSQQYHLPFGLASPAQEMALIARRHMHVYGTRAEQFGMQAVAQRAHAASNPAAIMREAITLEEWRNSRMIADPLRLFDCSLENDGAVALIVTTAERARGLRQEPVHVLAGAQGEHPIHTQLPVYFTETGDFGGRETGGWSIGRRLFESAGIGPGDVDVAMIFDHFTMAIPLTLEQYGFCGVGEGGAFIESGATRWPGGQLPVNTHGGSNGEAFIHGFNHLPEAVRQLRGTAVNQVEGCEVAFVNGSITDCAGAVLLSRSAK